MTHSESTNVAHIRQGGKQRKKKKKRGGRGTEEGEKEERKKRRKKEAHHETTVYNCIYTTILCQAMQHHSYRRLTVHCSFTFRNKNTLTHPSPSVCQTDRSKRAYTNTRLISSTHPLLASWISPFVRFCVSVCLRVRVEAGSVSSADTERTGSCWAIERRLNITAAIVHSLLSVFVKGSSLSPFLPLFLSLSLFRTRVRSEEHTSELQSR